MYCGLALHHAKLYDKIRRSEQKYKVNGQIYSNYYLNIYFCWPHWRDLLNPIVLRLPWRFSPTTMRPRARRSRWFVARTRPSRRTTEIWPRERRSSGKIFLNSPNIFSFDYFGLDTDDLSKVKQALFMFIDLFGLEKFDYNTLVWIWLDIQIFDFSM